MFHKRVRTVARFSVLAIFLFAATACGGDRNGHDVEAFFKKGKFGQSPDFVLTKQSIFRPGEWDLVAVFYGSVADNKNCQDAASAIMAKSGGEYTCMQLNK